ncbi:phenylalanine--tRNA ligase subunit alpha [Candidatus Woesearchaeota archaeon]|nr:phenylalanine--tRNA ligase subunit alpha [Candidatus Woesearchaeota archaeon]
MSILDQLTNLELKVLPVIGKDTLVTAIVEETNLKDIEVMRAVQWLSNKNLVTIREEVKELIDLDSNGNDYAKNGLPERQLLIKIKDEAKTIQQLEAQGLSKEEINISIGQLKKKVAINLTKTPDLTFEITAQGKKLLEKESLEEQFLKHKFPCELKDLKPEELFAYKELLSRKQIIKQDTKKLVYVTITEEGKSIDTSNVKEKIDKLTPAMIKSGAWKNKEFRSFDIESKVPKAYHGKSHFVNQAIKYIKQIWLEMGFEEMTGNHVHTAFRDLDALFVPQDHPAREMQDTFYIADPKEGTLPTALHKKVKAMHEHGGDTTSKGWQCKFSDDIAKQNLLRTHTTVLSAETIANLKIEQLPKKFFAVGKVYRNEALDWKHLFEFHQVEGIVIDPNATLKHLIGYLTEFYNKMGFEKVRIRPGHFPYTEPSLEVEVFHPVKKQWVELGGAGIFRPEVVIPLLGKDVPVLAWGQGMERGIVEYFNFTDLRDLYKNDIKQMREMKSYMK